MADDAFQVMPLLEEAQAEVEERLFVYFTNATTLLTTGGLALGLFFVIAALALYYYYYTAADSSTGRSSNGHYYEYKEDSNANSYDLLSLLYQLEKAFTQYSVNEEEEEEEGEECRRRVVCEAHDPGAARANPEVAVVFRDIVKHIPDAMVNAPDEDDDNTARIREILLAAHSDCSRYKATCPQVHLADLRAHKSRAGKWPL